jgi:dihydroneopterin aldolase
MDTIFIRDLVLLVRIGLTAHERSVPQRLVVDLVCSTSFGEVLRTGSLECGVNYSLLRKGILALAAREFVLLEEFGHEVIEFAFRSDLVRAARVTVQKPDIWTDGVPGVIMVRRRTMK